MFSYFPTQEIWRKKSKPKEREKLMETGNNEIGQETIKTIIKI